MSHFDYSPHETSKFVEDVKKEGGMADQIMQLIYGGGFREYHTRVFNPDGFRTAVGKVFDECDLSLMKSSNYQTRARNLCTMYIMTALSQNLTEVPEADKASITRRIESLTKIDRMTWGNLQTKLGQIVGAKK